MTATADLHALARTRAECARRVETLKAQPNGLKDPVADALALAVAESNYQIAEDAYQRALSLLTNHELINLGLKP